jgi:metal-responsive CopG/Arc/MetJ family transcriptional regulator
MAKQQTVQPRKRRGPPPTGKGTPVQVRLQPDLLAALDAFIKGAPKPKPTRPEAIRRLVEAGLKSPKRS